VHGSADDDYRVVVDEESLDWRDRTDTDLCLLVDSFAELLEPLADGRQVALPSDAFGVECWESVTLVDLYQTADRRVSRDARVRLAKLLDKCRAIDPQDDNDIPQSVRLHGTWREPSWGMAHALARAATGRAMSCLRVPVTDLPSGWTTVERAADGVVLDIHVLSVATQLPGFWRGVLVRENASESVFFELAERAFPGLMLANTLAFRQFKGSYDEVFPWVIGLLGALDDHFANALTRHHGDQNQVMAEFSSYGLTISPESPQTRKDTKAWAKRLVTYKGNEYRCEWHGKRLWDRDRVHFSLPIQKYQNRILIGIFTEHLPV
jgi:hypothetical protein